MLRLPVTVKSSPSVDRSPGEPCSAVRRRFSLPACFSFAVGLESIGMAAP